MRRVFVAFVTVALVASAGLILPAQSVKTALPACDPSNGGITLPSGFCALVVGGYTAIAFTEREFGGATKDELPASVRSTPGGYRSYSYWHSGYHGGK